MGRWEQQIHDLGIGLDVNDRHLSNLRFADDILLLATSKDDAICMLEILTLELTEIGLILNAKETKVLTTQAHDFDHIVLRDGSHFDVIADFECHRWLGKQFVFLKVGPNIMQSNPELLLQLAHFMPRNTCSMQSTFKLGRA